MSCPIRGGFFVAYFMAPLAIGGAKMNPLHVLWIVPLSAFLGMFVASLLAAGDDPDDDDEKSESGLLTED